MKEKTIGEYIEELSSSSPTPGGGSVSCFLLSLSSSLSEMVCALTPSFERYIPELKKLSDYFLKLAEMDEKAFDKVMEAYSLPKKTEEEKKRRKEAIQSALKEATNVPLTAMRRAKEIIPFVEILLKDGNKNAISDVGVSAITLKAGVMSAYLNVLINLKYIKDEKYREKTYKEANEIVRDIRKWGSDVFDSMKKIILSS